MASNVVRGETSDMSRSESRASEHSYETALSDTTQHGTDSHTDLNPSSTSTGQRQVMEKCTHGHSKDSADFDPYGPNVIHHDNIFLKPVVQTVYRQTEIEEVQRVKTIHRHIHHIVYHYQDVVEHHESEHNSHFKFSDPAHESYMQNLSGGSHNLVYQEVTPESGTDQALSNKSSTSTTHHGPFRVESVKQLVHPTQ